MRPGSEPRGFSILLVLAGLALATALFVGGLGAEGPLSPTQLAVLALALGAGIAATSVVARGSPHDALMFITFAGFMGAIVLGAVAVFGRLPHPFAAAVAAACGVAFVASATRLVLLQFARDPFPDALAERFDKGAVVEMDEVQFAVESPAFVASAARPGELLVWLQNTTDAPREVRVRLDLAGKARLLAPAESVASLAPLEAGVLAIPIGAEPSANGRTPANVWLTASGGGRRRRLRRANVVARPTSSWLKILEVLAMAHNPLHLLSLLRGERGYGVRLVLSATAAPGTPAQPLGPARWTSVWRESALARSARESGLRA